MVVGKINPTYSLYNYNTTVNSVNPKIQNQHSIGNVCSAPSFTAQTVQLNPNQKVTLRTELSNKDEKKKYNRKIKSLKTKSKSARIARSDMLKEMKDIKVQ